MLSFRSMEPRSTALVDSRVSEIRRFDNFVRDGGGGRGGGSGRGRDGGGNVYNQTKYLNKTPKNIFGSDSSKRTEKAKALGEG